MGLYVVLQYHDKEFEYIKYIATTKEEAEKMAQIEWGDCKHTNFKIKYIDSASVSKELFERYYG